MDSGMSYTIVFYLLLLSFCSFFPLLDSHPTIDDTLLDDEDSTKGQFTLEVNSTLGCQDWLQLRNGMALLWEQILDALASAINTSCECSFTKQHIFLDAMNCTPEARNKMIYHGEIRPVQHESNLSLLLHHLEKWGSSGAQLHLDGPLEIPIQTTLMILGITTQIVTVEAVDTTTEVFEGSGSGSAYTTVVMETETDDVRTNTATVQEVTTTEQEVHSTVYLPPGSSISVTASVLTMTLTIISSVLLSF